MKQILLIRHVVGEHNLISNDNCVNDVYDALLTPAGKKEAENYGYDILNIIKENNVSIFSSPLRRCLQTCFYMFKNAPKRLKFNSPKPLALLMETDDSYSSCGN